MTTDRLVQELGVVVLRDEELEEPDAPLLVLNEHVDELLRCVLRRWSRLGVSFVTLTEYLRTVSDEEIK
jgi:hypothetical protein